MARARWVSPDDYIDERLLRADNTIVSRDVRQVLQALKHAADKAGRLVDRPGKLRMQFFPLDADLDVDASLDALAALPEPAVIRYEVDGLRYLQITWPWDRIHPDKSERESKLPAPPGIVPRAETPATPESHPGEAPAHSRVTPGSSQGEAGVSPGETPATPEVTPGGLRVESGNGELSVESGVTETATETAVVDGTRSKRGRAREAAKIPRCVRATTTGTCGHDLMRERGMYLSAGTGGRGWLCKATEGGCGAVYPRDAGEILAQLSDHARAALEREVAAETAGRKQAPPGAEAARQLATERAEAAHLVEEFVYGERDGLNAEVKGATDAAALWSEISERVGRTVNSHSHATWFRPTIGARLIGNRLVVAVPNGHFAATIPKNYREVLAAALKALKRDGLELAFVTEASLLIERFDAWAQARKLSGDLKAEVLEGVRRHLGESAA